MTLTCTMKGGSKRDVRVPIVPPLSGYEDVKPRLLEMKALAQEGLGMVRYNLHTNQFCIIYLWTLNRSKPQKSHPLSCQQHMASSLDSFAVPFSIFISFRNHRISFSAMPNILCNSSLNLALGLFSWLTFWNLFTLSASAGNTQLDSWSGWVHRLILISYLLG